MSKSRRQFSPEEKHSILQEAEREGHSETCRKYNLASSVLECGGESIRGQVGRSGSWETFKTEKIGSIRLTKGRHKVVFRPASSFGKGGALLDLREIKLVRIGN